MNPGRFTAKLRSRFCPFVAIVQPKRIMSKAFLEIVELPDGRIVLRRSEEESPLVTLNFSGEAREFLQDRYIDVARAMFHAGLEAAGHLAEDEAVESEEVESVQHTLH